MTRRLDNPFSGIMVYLPGVGGECQGDYNYDAGCSAEHAVVYPPQMQPVMQIYCFFAS